MIIDCIKCYKKFELSSNLIPSEGRLVECGACHYQWFHKNEKKITKPTLLNEEIELTKKDIPDENVNISTNDNEKDLDIVLKNEEIKKKNNKISIFYILLISIISISALIILVDTFKYPISKIYPNVEVVLYNLYESITDIRLFFINLF